jgi:ribosomal protein S18 acetylase RimI-like enzyme
MEFVTIDTGNVDRYLSEIADIHYGAYSKEHFTSCFDKLLLEKYYKFLIINSDICLLAVDDGVVVGFIVSGYSVGRGVSQFIGDNRPSVIKIFLKNPRFMLEKAFSIISSRIVRDKDSPAIAPFRLMSISVKSGAQSRGVGSLLLNEFEQNLLAKSINLYGLSVRKKNERAVSFYFRNGFEVQKETRDSLYFGKELKNA